VDELRPRITAHSLGQYAAFERVYGPLTIQERIDAMGAAIISALTGEKDTMPKWDVVAAPEKPKQPVEKMIGFMRGLQSKKRKRRKR
jgi:hypothetical protein